MFDPFIFQSDNSPLLAFRQRMSVLPSPSKSPIPTMLQLGPGIGSVLESVTNPPDVMFGPFMSQAASCPALLRQRMSLLPSPSRSPTPATVQLASGEIAL